MASRRASKSSSRSSASGRKGARKRSKSKKNAEGDSTREAASYADQPDDHRDDQPDDHRDDDHDDDFGEVLVGELVDDDDMDDDDDDDDHDHDDDDDAEFSRRGSRSRSRRSQASEDAHHRLVKRDPLSAYVQETKRYPLLSREEENELAVRFAEEGDPSAARRLIEANLRLVVKIAYEYRRAHRNLLDLIQEGNIGLMQAVKKYDPYRGVKLSSYAAWWIRAYILKFVLNNWRLVKIGTTQAQRKLFFNLRKEKERLQQLGFQPTTALLAENLDVQEKEVIEMEKRMSAPDASLDAPVTTDDDGATKTRLDMLASEEAARPDLQVAKGEVSQLFQEKLEQFGQTLEGRDEAIFYERLLSDSPLTLQQIGDRFGISRERSRQLEKRLLRKLRQFLESEIGAAVDIEAMINE